MTAQHTPLTDKQVAKIRSMSLYWQEVRRRDDTSPLRDEANQVLSMLGVDGLLRVVEFCTDPVSQAGPDLLAALIDLAACSPCQNDCAPDDMTCASNKAAAAIAKAKPPVVLAREE